MGFNLHGHVLMNTTQERWRGRAKAVGWIIGGTTVGLCALVTPFILPALRKHCLPYVPATAQQVRLVVQHAKGQTLVDIGSGDGRVVRYGTVKMIARLWLYIIEGCRGS